MDSLPGPAFLQCLNPSMEEKGGLWDDEKSVHPLCHVSLAGLSHMGILTAQEAGKQSQAMGGGGVSGIGLLNSSQSQPLSWVLTLS